MPSGMAMLGDPWENLVDRRRAYAECLTAYESLLTSLSVRLNDLHGENRSQRYWRIVLGPWLLTFIQILRDRYELLKRARQLDASLSITRLASEDRIVVRDALDFIMRASFGDQYNFQLLSRIAETLGIDGEYVSAQSPTVSTLNPPSGRSSTASLLKTISRIRRWPILIDNSNIPLNEVLSLCVRAGGSASPLQLHDPENPVPPIDPAMRSKLRDLSSNSDFESIVAALLPHEIPWLHVEGRAAHESSIDAASMPPPRVLLSVGGWHYNEAFKTVAGSFAERGTRLVAVQHGGGYGLYDRCPAEDIERAATDSYWCWGWAELDGDPRLRNVPARSLSGPTNHDSPGDGMLLIACDLPLYRCGLQSQAQAWSFGSYLDDREEFFSELGALRGQCTVRFDAHGDRGWGQRVRQTKRFPEILSETARDSLRKRLGQCALAIVDHPATTLLDALALDRPTLMFWRPDIWDCRPSAQPLLDGLRRAGLLFDEPRAAARAAILAWNDPRAWWSRREAREAVGAFRAHMTLGAPDWRKQWSKALKAEVSAAGARA